MMLVQVLAAALVSENKTLSFPASVDSIPTSANREDHVSMSTAAARKCRRRGQRHAGCWPANCFVRARDWSFIKPLRPGRGVEAALSHMRERGATAGRDRTLHRDLEAVERLVARQFAGGGGGRQRTAQLRLRPGDRKSLIR